MRTAIFLALLLALPAFAEDYALPNGDTLRVWSEDGIDRAARRNAKGALVWYAALRASDPARALRVEIAGPRLRIYDGELARVHELVLPKPEGEIRNYTPPVLVVQRSAHPAAATIDLAKQGFTLLERRDEASHWSKDGWLYAAFGKAEAPDVVVRYTIEDSRSPRVVQKEFGGWYVGAGNDVTDDGIVTIARPFPEWFGEKMRADAQRRAEAAKALPPIQASRWIQSKPLKLEELRGKVVLLDFWGTWCAPCRASIPKLNALAKAYPNDLQIVAVHSKRAGETVEAFLKKNPFHAAIPVDTGETEKAYAVEAWPTY
ncbi:MAG TPA: TlpA disulfide reductase family protein, partial [Thermoanaerobaculia bacterium]|nr:TlpA disulfide reductase family protein [Thermoanaerobaculia bacterium]